MTAVNKTIGPQPIISMEALAERLKRRSVTLHDLVSRKVTLKPQTKPYEAVKPKASKKGNEMADKWTKDAPRITDPKTLGLIKKSISEGPVFLRHALYHGGGSPHWDVVSTYENFNSHITHAKAGDWLTLWSIKDLIEKKIPILKGSFEKLDMSSKLVGEQLSKMKKFLSVKFNEVLFVVIPQHGQAVADLNDIDGWEGFIEMASKFSGRAVNLYAFDERFLREPVHIIADAKVPNESGEVPLGGAY
jgi:hypothetical protein